MVIDCSVLISKFALKGRSSKLQDPLGFAANLTASPSLQLVLNKAKQEAIIRGFDIFMRLFCLYYFL
jgi:hypothetical protein